MPGQQHGRPDGAAPEGWARPLVERETELAAVTVALDRACAGTGGAVMIEAAAGLGKSRLLAESIQLARVRGMTVLRAAAAESEQDFTFAVALRLIEPCLAGLPADDRESVLRGPAGLARPLLTGELPVSGQAAARSPFSLLHGLYWLVANLAASGPLLICVDDLQWADDASLRFLLYLAGRVEDWPIVLLVVTRPRRRAGETAALAALRSAPGFTLLRLAPLGLAGLTELVRASVPEVPAEFCLACAEVTHGNPFYLHELLLAVDAEVSGGRGLDPGRIREFGTRPIVRAALFRLMRLGPVATALAEALAVIGDETPLQRAAALAGVPVDAAAGAADDMAAEELITSGQLLGFVHPLIRQSIYDEMPPAKRALAHAAAARLLCDSQLPPEVVAAHLILAPAASEDWAVRSLRSAARRATSQGAPQVAARYLRRALAEGGGQAARDDILLELGAAEVAAGIPGASEHLAAVLGSQASAAQRVGVQRLLARALAAEGEPAAAADTLERAIDELGADDHADAGSGPLRAGLLAEYLANSTFQPGLRQRAIARTEHLLSEPPEGTTAEARVLLAALAMRAGQDGRPSPRTVALAERAWAGGTLMTDEGPDGPGWLMAVWALALAEDYERAREVSGTALDAALAAGSVGAFATASYFRGYAHLRMGRLGEAQADAEQGIGTGSAEWHRYLVPSLVLQANALVERSCLDEAAQALARAAGGTQAAGMLEVPWTLHARGRLAAARGRTADALDLFEQAGAYLTDRLEAGHTVLPWRIDAARAAARLGRHGRARELAEAELAAAERRQAPAARGCAMGVLGVLAGGEVGLGRLSAAADLLASTPAELDHARALTDLGAALRRAGQRADARQPLAAALDIAGRLGADLLAARIREELAAAGVRPRPTARSGADALTPSERRVAELASRGLTNTEIAQALFVTPKTVEYHLRHVYQRLAIPGRRQLRGVLPPEQ